jgi:hypothetical protein
MWNCAKDWAEIAPGLTPVVALIAVLIAWRQLALNRTNQRETTAKTTFREFLKLCVQYPDLASGKPTSGRERDYEWFVAYFLWAAEETLEYSRKDRDWQANLRLHMTYHKDYLKNDQRFRDEDFPCYSAAVQELIQGVVGPIKPTVTGG